MSENTFGTYTSVNDMPIFADLVAEQGPFDPQKYIVIRRNYQSQYTIEAEQAYIEENGVRTQLVAWDFTIYDGLEDFTDLKTDTTLTVIEYDGARYNLWSNQEPDEVTRKIHSITFDIPNGGGQMHMSALAIPSDHPVLRCYRVLTQPE